MTLYVRLYRSAGARLRITWLNNPPLSVCVCLCTLAVSSSHAELPTHYGRVMMASAGGSQFLGDDGSAGGSLFLRPLCSDELWNVHRRESTLLPLSEGRVELADGRSVKLLGPCREGMYPVSIDSTGTGVRVECVPAAQLRLKGEMPVGAAHDVLFSSVEAMPNVKAMRTTADRLLAAMQICPDDWGFKYACWLFYATLLLDPRFEHETEDLVRHPLHWPHPCP